MEKEEKGSKAMNQYTIKLVIEADEKSYAALREAIYASNQTAQELFQRLAEVAAQHDINIPSEDWCS